ncbi:competence protein ComK [Bacillus sp. PS06]|uniref:competence protein ComK n=1 Tax=Bacillus sp. PS06 TaxID=2764176 RepID=UPI0017825CFA|nr:competence protein ComK [Bacillus sp. PS06]MBD8069385.1 competence protein ComK [Bacillus sp. PS06]
MNQILDDYEINQRTIALLPATHTDYYTIALEETRKLYVRKTPLQLIKSGCLDGGSTFCGRQKAVTHLTGAQQKVPLPINPQSQIFAFPTHSPQAFECSWIFYHHVKSIKPFTDKNHPSIQSILHFKNNQSIQMNESHYILQKQMQRTAICILQFTNTPHRQEE